MSPRKVNKEEKRREVALACSDLIHEVGMKKITVAQVAKTAGIGKGTVYEYFDNKDDIIFEIINIHIEQYLDSFKESIKTVKNTKDKIRHFFKFVLDDSEDNIKHFNGYKEFLSIVLADENSAMKEFNCDTHDFFKNQLSEILEEGVKIGDLKPESIDLAESLLIFEKGLVLMKMSQNDHQVQEKFEHFLNTLFKLIEIKK
ncbi:TetR/AcrR family transcriptional regulator [Arcobacter roscoffensis]|uniref:TetR/AcrR family transcriptional regulator n=1 Tax=Arcobacter roscoffensis TaxID=2961520 RepID=A0ABY5E5W6_9BACT|nr:TetR/AcrR family transcriptional regulator [Arcobacter roscoffensis]UTJ07252.1 TetR/AcrR family transcriptional regulator [Arcobacter roscoffensis]